jgi:hypothetical protein
MAIVFGYRIVLLLMRSAAPGELTVEVDVQPGFQDGTVNAKNGLPNFRSYETQKIVLSAIQREAFLTALAKDSLPFTVVWPVVELVDKATVIEPGMTEYNGVKVDDLPDQVQKTRMVSADATNVVSVYDALAGVLEEAGLVVGIRIA